MASLIEDELAPDIETSSNTFRDAEHSRLYISAKVRFLDETGELDEETKPSSVH